MGLLEKLRLHYKTRKLDALGKYLTRELKIDYGSPDYERVKALALNYFNYVKKAESSEPCDLLKNLDITSDALQERIAEFSLICPDFNKFLANLSKELNQKFLALEVKANNLDSKLRQTNEDKLKRDVFITTALETYIKMVSEGVIELSNEYKLIIHSLSSDDKELSELLIDTGLKDDEAKQLINDLISTGMVYKLKGASSYSLTQQGKALSDYCHDCAMPDYAKELADIINQWSELHLLVKTNKHKPDDKVNHYTELCKSTRKFIKKICNASFYNRFENIYSLVKGGLELQFNGGSHVANYKRSLDGIEGIIKLLSKIKF